MKSVFNFSREFCQNGPHKTLKIGTDGKSMYVYLYISKVSKVKSELSALSFVYIYILAKVVGLYTYIEREKEFILLMHTNKYFVIQNRQTRALCGAQCMGHVIRTWSAVCSEAPNSRFGEGARPHLCKLHL